MRDRERPWSARRALVLAVGLGAIACTRADRASTAPPTTPALAPIEVVQRIALLAAGEPLAPDAARALAEQLPRDPGAVVDAVLRDPHVASRTAPQMLLASSFYPPLHGQGATMVLRSFPADGATVLGLEKPCRAADAVRVHPWWALSTEVLVCPDSYRPDKLPLAGAVDCSATMYPDEARRGCGCGPNLMWCMRDLQHRAELMGAFLEESVETIAYAVRENRPLDWLFTAEETVRRPIADLNYVRSAIACGAMKSFPDGLGDRAAAPSLRPRPSCAPGSQAGLLTATHLLHIIEGTRQRQNAFGNILFCFEPRSTSTELTKILSFGAEAGANVRDGAEWERLARMPGCTTCHARIDYAIQFFNAYPRSIDSVLFKPALALSGEGTFYMKDIRDERGKGPLTALGYAQIATKQPEFAACMTERVLTHVFGAEAGPKELTAVREAFDRTRQLQPMLRAALLRYVELARVADAPHVASPVRDKAPAPAGTVRVSARAHEILEQQCGACHEDKNGDLTKLTLPRELALEALVQIASGQMPKGQAASLSATDRWALTTDLLVELFPDPADRARAEQSFLGAQRVPRLFRYDTAFAALGLPTAPGEPRVHAFQLSTHQGHSADTVMRQAEYIATHCRTSGKTEAEHEACIEAAWRQRRALTLRPGALGVSLSPPAPPSAAPQQR